MTEAELQVFYFLVRPWIDGTLSQQARMTNVASFGFSRLPSYFGTQLLDSTKVVIVDKVPIPPLKRMGLSKFAAFEELNPCGISYLDTYFVKSGGQTDESIHFHELVHIIQWRVLGPEGFFAAYMDGLQQQGYRAQDYRKSPLELMASRLQAQFEEGWDSFDVKAEVEAQLARL